MAAPILIVNERTAAVLEGLGWVRDRDFVVSGPLPASGYPDGYRDPPWTTPEDFASTVIPARAEALTEVLNASLPDWAREAGLRLEWSRLADDPIGDFTDRMLDL
jgi:hypothetical protein